MILTIGETLLKTRNVLSGWGIAEAPLEAELLPSEQESIETLPTSSSAAYALYLRATNNILSLGEPTALPETRRAVISDLDRAIDLDPEFALAYAARAWVYIDSMAEPYVGNDWQSRKAELEQLTTDNAFKTPPRILFQNP